MTRQPHPPAVQTGFTLVELIITLTVAAILMAAAAPSFRKFVQDSRTVTAANEMVRDINLARSEAIARRVTVILCRSADPEAPSPVCGGTANTWSTGWLVYATDGNIGERSYDSDTDTLLRIGKPATGQLEIKSDSDGDSLLGFGRDGALRKTATVAYGVCDKRGFEHGRLVSITLTGRPSVENTTTNNATDCTPT